MNDIAWTPEPSIVAARAAAEFNRAVANISYRMEVRSGVRRQPVVGFNPALERVTDGRA